MGRRSKYTPEIVEKILSVLKVTGSDKAAYLCVGINADTFYKWKTRYPEFTEALVLAGRIQEFCAGKLHPASERIFKELSV